MSKPLPTERLKLRKHLINRVINSAVQQGMISVGKRTVTIRDKRAFRELLEWTFGWGESCRNDKIVAATKDWS
jgi:hypothetical protein